MRKRYVVFWLALFILGVCFAVAYSQDDMTLVKNDGFANPQRTPALFKHDEHNETAGVEECNECHHVYENGVKVADESSEDRLCSDCHDVTASGNTPSLLTAFHTNCKGCHESQKKGPIMCGECHVRKK